MRKTWSFLDFILIFVGGLIGSVLAIVLGLALGDEAVAFVLALVGQMAGHLITFWLLSRSKEEPVGLEIEPRDPLYIGLGIVLQIGLALLFLPLANVLVPEGGPTQEITNTLLSLEEPWTRVIAFGAVVALAPITEEIMFRGVLLKAIRTQQQWVPVVVTALVFALFHVLDFDMSRFLQSAAINLPILFIAGLVLALLTLRTGRLGPAIFTHSGFNLVAAIAILLPLDLLESVVEGLALFS